MEQQDKNPISTLSGAYIRHLHTSPASPSAFSSVEHILRGDDDEEILRLLDALIQSARTMNALSLLGAGPIESVLDQGISPLIEKELLARVKSDPRWTCALQSTRGATAAWLVGNVPELRSMDINEKAMQAMSESRPIQVEHS